MKTMNIQEKEGLRPQVVGDGAMAYAVIPQDEVTQSRIHFVEIEPGGSAYGYHWHETEEEAFYVISGTASVRTPKGELTVKAGQVITFPAGKEGAHQMGNASSTEKLLYLDFGVVHFPEICHLPDINKLMVISSSGVRMEEGA